MGRKACLLLGALLTSLAGTARAADVTGFEPVPYSWSGLYAGVQAGAGALVTGTDFATASTGFDLDEGGDGFLYGGLIGFNLQVGERFVLGLQGDIAFTDIDTQNTLLDSAVELDSIDLDFIASASLRLGVLLTPDTLLYAIGGYSYAEFGLELPASQEEDLTDGKLEGFHIGAGLETRLADRLTARIEYRYTDFGRWHPVEETDIIDMTAHTHTGMLALAYNLFPTEGEGMVAEPASAVVSPPVSWTGVYFGANGGAGALLSDFDIVDVVSEDFFEGYEGGGEGLLASVMAGANWQLNDRLVLGFEGALGRSDMDWELGFGISTFEEVLGVELDWFASASARVGWLASPETMIYVIGGYSYAKVDFSADFTVQEVVFPALNDREGLEGLHAGAGIETMLTPNLTARIEYRYSDYGTRTFTLDELTPDGQADIDARTHTGMIGLAWLIN
jgi:outer membrane immunogenic protein